jgi:hypothetical protein
MSRSLISKKNAIENERPQTPFVWPAKCHSIGVIEIAKFDVTAQAQGGSRGAAVLQTGGDSQPLFSDSLFAATTVSAKKDSDSDGGGKATQRQKPEQDTKVSSAVPDASAGLSTIASQQVATPPQVILPQQAQKTDPATMQLQASSDEVTAIADASTQAAARPQSALTAATSTGTKSNAAQLAALQTAGVQSNQVQPASHPQPAPSQLPVAAIQGTQAAAAPLANSANGISAATTSTASNASPSTTLNQAPDTLPPTVMNAITNAIQSALANLAQNSNPAVQGVVSNSVQQSAPAAISVGAGVASVLGLSATSAVKPSATVSAAGKDDTSDASGVKQHAQPTTETGSKTNSQDAAPSGDQSQGGASAQAQSAAPAPINFASQTAAATAQAQNIAVASPLQTSPVPAGNAAAAAKTVDHAAPTSTAAPQALPTINTAQLIHTMGQSEMRVGMRSTEFGNISISTSTTRDLISAQISLDHGELAKTIAAHLPEMQSRMGGNQAIDVRIDMNGAATGQNAGTSAGMYNGSADQSRGGRQQAGNAPSGYVGNGVVEQQLSTAAAAMTAGYAPLEARLDIRV